MMIARKSTPKSYIGNVRAVARQLGECGFGPGVEVHGFSDGFSAIDLIDAVIGAAGCQELVIATWTAAGADMDRVERFVDERDCAVSWLVDKSFPNRQPALCEKLRRKFGDDSIRVLSTHAKFALVKGGDFDALVLTSANLNANPRIENFSIITDAEFIARYSEMVESVFAAQKPGAGFASYAPIKRATDAAIPATDVQDEFSFLEIEDVNLDAISFDGIGLD